MFPKRDKFHHKMDWNFLEILKFCKCNGCIIVIVFSKSLMELTECFIHFLVYFHHSTASLLILINLVITSSGTKLGASLETVIL